MFGFGKKTKAEMPPPRDPEEDALDAEVEALIGDFIRKVDRSAPEMLRDYPDLQPKYPKLTAHFKSRGLL